MKIIVVIPARYGSSRFEGKVLAKETGKYLLQHTYEKAIQSRLATEVFVATDDLRVQQACQEFGAPCVMTRTDHLSGTDRIAEVVSGFAVDIVINLQADEPEIDPLYIDRVASLLVDHWQAEMSTLLAPFDSADQVANPNIVKALVDRSGRAIYFSRSVIPYDRQADGIGAVGLYRRHLGIYAYRKDFLMQLTGMETGFLEKTEKLEQLRVLENGYTILTALVEKAWDGIDTAEQYQQFVERMKNKGLS